MYLTIQIQIQMHTQIINHAEVQNHTIYVPKIKQTQPKLRHQTPKINK